MIMLLFGDFLNSTTWCLTKFFLGVFLFCCVRSIHSSAFYIFFFFVCFGVTNNSRSQCLSIFFLGFLLFLFKRLLHPKEGPLYILFYWFYCFGVSLYIFRGKGPSITCSCQYIESVHQKVSNSKILHLTIFLPLSHRSILNFQNFQKI